MANKTTTLHPLRSKADNLYPNVLEDNIPDTIQRKLTAGENITISDDNVISATGGVTDVYTKAETDDLLILKTDNTLFETFKKNVDEYEDHINTEIETLYTKTSDIANDLLGNYYMKTESDSKYATKTELSNQKSTLEDEISLKQDALTTAQLNACNSGITASKVALYDNYPSQIMNKQDKLVSGTNIKTVNGNSLLGSGDIEISGGGDTSVGVITLTDAQAYDLININSATLTSENLEVIKSSRFVDIKYNSMTLISLTVNSMVNPQTVTTTPIYIYHAYAIVWIVANYPILERIYFDSDSTTATLSLENIGLLVTDSTFLNNRQFKESGDNIIGPQFYEHNIYMLYESGDTTFCIRFAFVNNVADTYTSVSALQGYLGTNFVKGCSGYMTSSAGYGNAYSVTYNKVTGIVGTSQASITYSSTGLTITDTIKEMS